MKLSEWIRDYRAGMFGALKIQDEWADEAEQLEERAKALENILWNCRHGGKGGVPVDYQNEVDRLLATRQ